MIGPQQFVSNPVVIEAIQFTGVNFNEIYRWIGNDRVFESRMNQTMSIVTLEGTMEAQPGDWIIRGTRGEFYPCKPDVFAVKYRLYKIENDPSILQIFP